VIKSELVQRIAAKNAHLYLHDAERIVNAILDEITKGLRRRDRVEMRGFGVFSVRQRPARIGRNPLSGRQVLVERKLVPFFKSSKEMRDRLNSDKAVANPRQAGQEKRLRPP